MPDTIEIVEEVSIIEIEGEESLASIEESGVEIVSESAQGPAGPPGADGVAESFEAIFSSSLTWVVNHNLGRRPLLTVLTEGGAEILTEVIHTSVNQFIVYFAVPTAGRVRYL